MFGVDESLNWYSWFVCFYLLTICTMPYLHKLFLHFQKYGWLVAIFCFYLVECCLHLLPNWEKNWIIHNLFIYTSELPLVIVGYMCGKWNNDGSIPSWFEGNKKTLLSILAVILVLTFNATRVYTFGFCLQAFYTPILVFAVIGIYNSCGMGKIGRLLHKVGDKSMYMWFLHAVFFTSSVNMFTRNLVFKPFHSFFYTFAMTFLLTYIGAYIIKSVLTPILKK